MIKFYNLYYPTALDALRGIYLFYPGIVCGWVLDGYAWTFKGWVGNPDFVYRRIQKEFHWKNPVSSVPELQKWLKMHTDWVRKQNRAQGIDLESGAGDIEDFISAFSYMDKYLMITTFFKGHVGFELDPMLSNKYEELALDNSITGKSEAETEDSVLATPNPKFLDEWKGFDPSVR